VWSDYQNLQCNGCTGYFSFTPCQRICRVAKLSCLFYPLPLLTSTVIFATIRFAIPKTQCCTQTSGLCVIETKLLPIKVSHCRNSVFFYLFCSCDLDLDPINFIYWHKLDYIPSRYIRWAKMNLLCQGCEQLSYYIHTYTHRYATETIYQAALQVVS